MKPNLNDMFIRYHLERHFSQCNPKQLERLLDLGCGQLSYAHLYTHPQRISFSADIERRADALSVLSTASALPFITAGFDTVLLSEVIEHVPDERSVLMEISRVLKPGGTLIITWPFNYGLHEQPHDYRRPTEHGMDLLLRTFGFEPIDIMRRGDLIGVLLTLVGELGVGTSTWLCRLPLVGMLFIPLDWANRNLIYIAYLLYFKVMRDAARLHPAAAGEPKRGFARFFVSWSLGYCVTARKKESPECVT